jgi:16S rRNA (guanine527-N7)-methyltransferase
MDVGTGGGFPGLPLAIMFPDSEFSLVDSIGKKIMVVNDLVEKLELKNVKTHHTRAENIDEKFHFITSRAVTAFPEFYQLVKNKIAQNHFNQLKNGIIYLKGGDFSAEVNRFGKRLKIFEISNLFKEDYFESKKVIYLSF